MTYVCFLRGVNVNGRKMLMKDVTSIFASLGFSNVKTVLASGNVIFDLSEDMELASIKAQCEKALSDYYSSDVYCLLYPIESVELMTKHDILVESQEQLYCLLTDQKDSYENIIRLFSEAVPSEGELLLGCETYLLWKVRKGMTLKTDFGKILGNKKFRSSLTSRNMNTIIKIVNKAKKDR